eukprot:3556590-Amphidinium_carterae.1
METFLMRNGWISSGSAAGFVPTTPDDFLEWTRARKKKGLASLIEQLKATPGTEGAGRSAKIGKIRWEDVQTSAVHQNKRGAAER